jgi:hypothetical protein
MNPHQVSDQPLCTTLTKNNRKINAFILLHVDDQTRINVGTEYLFMHTFVKQKLIFKIVFIPASYALKLLLILPETKA